MLATAAVVSALAPLRRPATAQVLPSSPPILLRLRGHVGPPPRGASTLADLKLQVRRRRIRFQVDEAFVLRGDRLAADVLADVTPYDPSFYVRGPDELLDRLLQVKPGDSVEMIGQARTASRQYLLGELKPNPKPRASAERRQDLLREEPGRLARVAAEELDDEERASERDVPPDPLDHL
jgi:hypothetical protein